MGYTPGNWNLRPSAPEARVWEHKTCGRHFEFPDENHICGNRVVLFLLIRNDSVLMEWRKYGDSEGWVFPGGKPKGGEDPLQTLEREFLEEIGVPLHVDVVQQLPEFEGFEGYRVHAFVIDGFQGPIPPSTDRGHVLAWLSLRRAIEGRGTLWSTTDPIIIRELERRTSDGARTNL